MLISPSAVSDYIWGCYHPVAVFKSYLVLERNADADTC